MSTVFNFALPLFFGTYSVIFILNLVIVVQLRRFHGLYFSISTDEALSAFKTLARTNMIMALVSIPLWMLAILSCGAVVFGHSQGFMMSMVANGVVLALALYGRKFEKSSRTLPASGAFAAEYQRVSTVWTQKALPDF